MSDHAAGLLPSSPEGTGFPERRMVMMVSGSLAAKATATHPRAFG
jgi:hypothetical protein